ncbi:MAG: matrixin family metalloprotease [Verrucomicrobiota bacterium]
MRQTRTASLLCFLWWATVLAVVPGALGFVLNLDPSGQPRRWLLSAPHPLVSTNIVNPATKAVRYFLAADAYTATNAAAELNAIRAAFSQWQSVPGTSLKFEEGGLVPPGADGNTSDQTNLIFWAKNSLWVNNGRDYIFGMIAVTYPRVLGENTLAEADIVLNGVQVRWFTDINDTNSTRQFVESTVLHEIGHLIGLEHSPVGGATMFAWGAEGVSTHVGLSRDEIAAAQLLYPGAPLEAGHLRGQVLINSTAVFGAAVIAEDAAGNVVSGTVTRENGWYELPGLPPGNYQVRVTPLDPAAANSLYRLVPGSDIASAFAGAMTGFLPSVNTPAAVVAGATQTLDFSVTPGEPAFRITRIRPPTRESDFFNAINAAASIRLGQSNWIVGVYSPNLPGSGATLKVTGDGLALGASSFTTVTFSGTTPSLNLISIRVSVSPEATPGLRSFVVQQGTNTAIANGFLEVLPAFPDDNFDSLDDSFQRRYFPLFTSAEASPGADPDGDALENRGEFLAGTNPTNASSVLRIEQVTVAPSGTTLAWQSVPGRRYQVSGRSQLGSETWQPLGVPVSASGTSTQFVDPSEKTNVRFYRVEVLP